MKVKENKEDKDPTELVVEFDFKGYNNSNLEYTIEKLLDLLVDASSPRVKLQNGTLRPMSKQALKALAANGPYKCDVWELDNTKKPRVNAVNTPEAIVNKTLEMAKTGKMSTEQRLALIAQLEAMNE